MKRLVWDDRALDDLDAIALYIAKDSPRAAERVVTYMREAALSLEVWPELGREVSGEGVREFILTRYPYLLVYEIVGGEVHILAAFHHRQHRR